MPVAGVALVAGGALELEAFELLFMFGAPELSGAVELAGALLAVPGVLSDCAAQPAQKMMTATTSKASKALVLRILFIS